MNRVSQVSINSKHLRSAQRAIESYLYTLAHKHELLNLARFSQKHRNED